MGGWSSERPVSLMSGEGVAKALEERGHKVTRIDMGRAVALRLAEAKPDVVFNAARRAGRGWHGAGDDGPDGPDLYPFGPDEPVIAIDKELTKQALVPHGIAMPQGTMVPDLHRADPLPRPYVLKPVNEGSSVGVAIVTAEGTTATRSARRPRGRGRSSTNCWPNPISAAGS
jgi:D-alanine-D-alanine ligase